MPIDGRAGWSFRQGHEACSCHEHLPPFKPPADMKLKPLFVTTLAVASLGGLAPCAVHADDSPSPCASLKRIVAAAPGGLASLTADDGKGVAEPYGDDAACSAAHEHEHANEAADQPVDEHASA
ncbi:MAG: Predicted cobalt transporter CbtA [uncultured Paraburkholderia sp.]|nr:MAG: Predicted cobalt transporter CbtA [uncultured Paraburkholderia sp.]